MVLYKKKRIFWLNSNFCDDLNIANGRLVELIFNVSPFQLYKNANLKVISYIRDSENARLFNIKLEEPFLLSDNCFNSDKDGYPTIYNAHTGVEGMTTDFFSFELIPQQIIRFVISINDRFNNRLGFLLSESASRTTTGSFILPRKTLYSFNYGSLQFINAGSYTSTFSEGSINFNNITDRSYPILRDGSGNNINPIAQYGFDSAGSGLGSDMVGGFNLTNNNSPSFDNAVRVRGAGSVLLNTTNASLETSSFFDVRSRSFSVSFWSRRNATGSISSFFQFGSGFSANSFIAVYYVATNRYTVNFGGTSTLSTNAYSDANQWVFHTFTYNATNLNFQFFRNGALEINGTAPAQFQGDLTLRVGRWDIYYFKGNLDDFRVYDGVLTAGQRSELLTGRISFFDPPSFMLGLEIEEKDDIKKDIANIYRR